MKHDIPTVVSLKVRGYRLKTEEGRDRGTEPREIPAKLSAALPTESWQTASGPPKDHGASPTAPQCSESLLGIVHLHETHG